MSGGHFNYQNDALAKEVFGYMMSPDYGEKGFGQGMMARKRDPFEDKQISELVWDVFCLLHSLDYYCSGDTCEDTYRQDINYFKDKWLNKSGDELAKSTIDKTVAEMKNELYKTLGLDDANDMACNLIFGVIYEKGACSREELGKVLSHAYFSKKAIDRAIECLVARGDCILDGNLVKKA